MKPIEEEFNVAKPNSLHRSNTFLVGTNKFYYGFVYIVISKQWLRLHNNYMLRILLFFCSSKMSSSTSSNFVENANNLSLALSGEHWTFSAHEDKYLCLVKGCRAKGYGAKNHFRKHMLSHSLHVVQDKRGRPKKSIGNPERKIIKI